MGEDPLRELVEKELVVEREGWAAERIARVTTQLQLAVMEHERLETLVVWSEEHTAFTGPGRTVYVSRRLLERLSDDDAAAFVVAHELAHHRLGHLPLVDVSRAAAIVSVELAIHMLERLIATRDNELDADALAIEMCLDAGYDPDRCLTVFELLVNVSLDYGDVDGVVGSARGEPAGSHPSLHTRLAAVRERLAAYRRGERVSLDISRARKRKRRRKLAIAAGAIGAAAVLLILRRR